MTTPDSPPDTVLLAATHRSGSYLACDWLAQYANLPFAEEYLNDYLWSARQKLHLSANVNEVAVFHKLVEEMRENKGVFALKAMWPAFASFFWRWARSVDPQRKEFGTLALSQLGSVKILFIRRENKISQAVSFEKARQTGVWRSPSTQNEEEEPPDLLYSYERILECLQQVEADERAWTDFFEHYRLPYQEIWYEQMVADPKKVLSEATAFLGIQDQGAELPVRSRFKKQRSSVNDEWAQRFKARYTAPPADSPQTTSVTKEPYRISLDWEISTPIQLDSNRATIENLRLRHESGPDLEPHVDAEHRGLWRVDFFITADPKPDLSSSPLEKIWTVSLEHPIKPGEEAVIEVRLPGWHRLKENQLCARLVVAEDAVVAQSPAREITINPANSLSFFEEVLGGLEEAPWDGWIQLPKLGGVMVNSFPYIYHNQHGWWMIDVEKSKPGVLRIVDFELGHAIVYTDFPTVFHILDPEAGMRKLRFLGIKDGLREFLDEAADVALHYPRSASGEQENDTDDDANLESAQGATRSSESDAAEKAPAEDPRLGELNAILAKFQKYAGQRSALAMNTPAERAYVQWATQDYYQGAGCIVELGCWLGSLTHYLCEGLTANPKVNEKGAIHVYDRFQWTSIMKGYVAATEHSGRYREGDDYSDFFIEKMGKHAAMLNVTKGDLTEQGWVGQPIEILLVDVMKNPALTAAVYQNFFGSLIPGKALILHQDYLTFGHPWIHLLTYLLRDSLELKHVLPKSGMVSFRVTQPFDQEIDFPESTDGFSADLIERAYEWNFQLFPEQNHACLATAAIHLHLQRKDLREAEKTYQRYHSLIRDDPNYSHMLKFNHRFFNAGQLSFLSREPVG